ncbi:MAG: hypothetical protein ACTSUE_19425 [Promethearchaeota archaeon]
MAKKQTRKKMSSREIRTFTSKKMNKVRLLMDSGKSLEAIVYLFHILTWLIEDKYDKKKAPSDTVKEFLTGLVSDEVIPPSNVYPFVNLFEEVLYSHHELPGNVMGAFRDRWAPLYKDVVGDTPPNL